ncbi:septal ring lytic transglycosylase RlpA family protein [Anaerosoma tenue]|uniref:septal ring lytic transglycosylase RlpA family protein n=1 Tax=Anaerosoma tenue TaxID=2933588 RepID=UPI0022608A6C|nr:septal ring lytic transglycosylase RlpA family protein [Anaerosoma tenue]MCK8114280.1 septal ring lytic transglycosylase RlpA family protein [Anaerosoma tenue]
MRPVRTSRRAYCAAALAAIIALAGLPAFATESTTTPSPDATSPARVDPPLAGLSNEVAAIRDELDEAAARAVDLEAQIEDLDADARALEERVAITHERIVAQRILVSESEERLALAEERFHDRLVETYKRGTFNPLSILLSSDTLTDLISRVDVLTRIAEGDSQVVADLNIATADARYQQTQLEDLLAQDRLLKQQQDERRDRLASLLAEQNALVERLTEEERSVLAQIRTLTAQARRQWQGASIPVGTDIPRAYATVDTQPDARYLISAYMPREYRSTGERYSAVCSWYGPGFNGRNTASGQVFNQDDLTCASRTLPFGTVLALTRGDRRVIVYVNDRGPYVAGRDLDLSKAAAAALGFSGVATVQVEVVTAVR